MCSSIASKPNLVLVAQSLGFPQKRLLFLGNGSQPAPLITISDDCSISFPGRSGGTGLDQTDDHYNGAMSGTVFGFFRESSSFQNPTGDQGNNKKYPICLFSVSTVKANWNTFCYLFLRPFVIAENFQGHISWDNTLGNK